MNNQALFITDKKYVDAEIHGGVQLCTKEYTDYIKQAGYEATAFLVEPMLSFKTRIKVKLGIEAYERYAINPYLKDIVHAINSSGIKLIFFNQLNLAFWAGQLKPHIAGDVKFVGLSHGNESADSAHEVAKAPKPNIFHTWRLGKLIAKEIQMFSTCLDGVIVLSEQEIAINQWLGSSKLLYLPRLLKPNFLLWQPTAPQAGFAGTLDHLPNTLGIKYLCEELKKRNFGYTIQLVGGPVSAGQQLATEFSFINYNGTLSDQQLIDEVKTWSVSLNPVFWYSRGASTKLAQAINWGIPCITTPAGRRGYDLQDEEIVTDKDTPESFADKLIKALQNENYLGRLKKASEQNATKFNAEIHINRLKTFLQTFWDN